jgi:8-oxo-dGTP pyrophosphatase MutT (NUDIX family)
LIGSKVEFGESSVDAAIREFEEEVGISLEGPINFLCQKQENDTSVEDYINNMMITLIPLSL